MDPNVRWITVVTKHDPRTEEVVARYLYNNAKVFYVMALKGVLRTGAYCDEVVIVVAQGGGDLDRAASGQAERLRSGNMAAKVHETYLDACEHLREGR